MTAPPYKRYSVHALLGLAVILMVGVAVLGDYGQGLDTKSQRHLATRTIEFISGQADSFSQNEDQDSDRYYGIAGVRTGQFNEQGRLWTQKFALPH